MKNFILTLLTALLVCTPLSTQAKNNEEKCVITLLDGNKISGKVVKTNNKKYGPNNVSNLYSVKVKEDNGNEREISADEANSLVITYDDGTEIEFMSLYAVKNFTLAKNMNKSGHRYFWLVIQKGKNLIGFASTSSITTVTGVGFMNSIRSNSLAYSYCKKGDEIAVTYYVPSVNATGGLTADIRRAFDRFPKMANYIESDDFKLKDFKKNPFGLLNTLDDLQ